MLASEILLSAQPEATTAPATEADIVRVLKQFQSNMSAGQVCNFGFMWETILKSDLRGDALIVKAAISSLTRIKSFGCRSTHKAVARRANALKPLLRLANEIGRPRIIEVIAAYEKGSE